jgi:hypothetical protein
MAGGLFGGGNGTTTTPYLVEDAADLNAVRNIIAAHYKQVNNIDMTAWGAFTPIGTSASGFTGSYDGQDFEIINLIVNLPTTNYVGLFAMIVSPGVVNRIVIRNGSVIGQDHTGGIVGFNNNSLVSSCDFYGEVKGKAYTSGISGSRSGTNGKIMSCRFYGLVHGTSDASGISRHNGASHYSIQYCHFEGTLKSNGTVAGIDIAAQSTNMLVGDCSVIIEGLEAPNFIGIQGGKTSVGGGNHVYRCTLHIKNSISTGAFIGISSGGANDCHVTSDPGVIVTCSNFEGIAGGSSSFSRVAIRCSCSIDIVNCSGNIVGITLVQATDCFYGGSLLEATVATGNTSPAGKYVVGVSKGTALRCYSKASIKTNSTQAAGIVGGSGVSASNCYFLGAEIRGAGATTSEIGRISSHPTATNANNYALDTSIVVLE